MKLGEKIRTQRKNLGMNQADLCAATGISPRSLRNYENGTTYPRTQKIYEKLALGLQMTMEELIGNEENFVLEAKEKYGSRGQRQAHELVADATGLFAGGSISEADKDALMKALQEAYWIAKEENVAKYTPKKYQNKTED